LERLSTQNRGFPLAGETAIFAAEKGTGKIGECETRLNSRLCRSLLPGRIPPTLNNSVHFIAEKNSDCTQLAAAIESTVASVIPASVIVVRSARRAG